MDLTTIDTLEHIEKHNRPIVPPIVPYCAYEVKKRSQKSEDRSQNNNGTMEQ